MTQDVTLDEHLSTLFGDSRAEWLGKRIFDLFAKPAYFPELEQRRPCVLIGGRGTGKTMVLRGLSYQGRQALSNSTSPSDWPYYGLYYKVNTKPSYCIRWARIIRGSLDSPIRALCESTTV